MEIGYRLVDFEGLSAELFTDGSAKREASFGNAKGHYGCGHLCIHTLSKVSFSKVSFFKVSKFSPEVSKWSH